MTEYVPSARPGHRAPHSALDQNKSVLNHVGDGFLLISGTAARHNLTYLRATRMPITVYVTADPDLLVLHGIDDHGVVLMRLDGHVFWRALNL
ncbi:hypothetical protein OG205_10135 [Lentzea sp. NBC_00516]|nr:hypothetical protein OG205_10135 [Lentzea sp. NBC_00516]